METTRLRNGWSFVLMMVLLFAAERGWAQEGIWETRAPMTSARSDPFVGAIGDTLYVAGGWSGGDTPTLQAYNTATDTWSTLQSMPGGRYQGAAGVIDGKLYVVGGWTTSPGLPNSNLFVYTPGTNTWESKASMPVLSGCGAAGVIDGKLYVITPCDGFSGYRSFLHVYDPGNNTWTRLADSPHDHAGPAAGVIDGKFYVAGGVDDSGRHGFLDVYDPGTNTWTPRDTISVALSNMTGAVLDGKLYAIGGHDGISHLNTVYVYDPATDTWSDGPAMPIARASLAAAVIDSMIYVVGGGNAGGLVDTVVVFIPATEQEVLPDQPITLALGAGFGAPGDTAFVPVTLVNPNTAPVGGLQFTVISESLTDLLFESFRDSVAAFGFEANAEAHGESTIVLIHTETGAFIPPDTTLLGYLLYRIDEAAAPDSVLLRLADITIGDTLGVGLPDSSVDGVVYIGRAGDLNGDGDLNILDVIRLVRILIGKDPTPEVGSLLFFTADVYEDGMLNIQDVVLLINKILGIASKPVAVISSGPALVGLGALQATASGQPAIPVTITGGEVIAGLELTFSFDPARLMPGTPVLTERSAGMAMDYRAHEGVLRVVVYSLGGQGIAPGAGPVLLIPVSVRQEEADLSLTIVHAALADRQAWLMPVVVETTPAKGAGLPTVFALRPARPNPFNPAVRLAYEVPQQTRVTITVYNLLGQEVVHLVDGLHAPGRYEVMWNGRNALGQPAASGVYLYRMTTETGFVQTRRMTMIK